MIRNPWSLIWLSEWKWILAKGPVVWSGGAERVVQNFPRTGSWCKGPSRIYNKRRSHYIQSGQILTSLAILYINFRKTRLLNDGSGRFSCHLWIQQTGGVQGRVISSHYSDALHSLWILTLKLNVYSEFVSWKIFSIFFPRFSPTPGVWFLLIVHSFIYGYAMQLVGS